MNVAYRKYGLYFYGLCLLFFVVRVLDGLTISQLMSPFMYVPRQDPLVWLSEATGWPKWFTDTYAGTLLDGLMLLLPLVIFILLWLRKPAKKWIAVHWVLTFVYVLAIFCFPSLSVRKYLGFLLLPLLFLFSGKRFEYYFQLLRYYVCFVFASAGLWKLFRGSLFHDGQMGAILKAQHTDNIVGDGSHFTSKIVLFLIENETISSIMLLSAFVFQMAFLLGFFTRKYDRLLLLLMIVFILADFLVMRIEYWEYFVFLPLFFVKESNRREETLVLEDGV